MDDDIMQSSEELAFIPEQLEPLLTNVIDLTLKNESYDEAKVQVWVDAICDGCMKLLTELNKPFKYVVSCMIMQRNGAGIHSAHSCFFDVSNDNVARIAWPLANARDQHNSRMYCIVTVFGVAF